MQSCPVDFPTVFKTWLSQWSSQPSQKAIDDRLAALELSNECHLALLPSMFEWAQTGMARAIERYLAPFADNLNPIVDVTTLNPHRLLDFAQSGRQGVIGNRTRFECIRGFDMGVALLLGELDAPQTYISDERDKFVDLLVANVFRPGEEQTIPIYSYHRQPSYAVESIGFGKDTFPRSRHKRVKSYLCRVFEDGSPAFFYDRVKGRFEDFTKRIHQVEEGTKTDPFTLLDKVGLTFVVETPEVAWRLVRRLTKVLGEAGGKLNYRESNMTGNGRGRMDKTNRISSPNFRAAKYEAWFNGRCYEVLFMTFRDFISTQFATTRENHELYRVVRWYEDFAPALFPEPIYGIAWKHKRIQKELLQCKVDELNWQHAKPHKF